MSVLAAALAGAALLTVLVLAALFAVIWRRLAARAGDAMREVRGSRARIAATAERERRRIERDLHDGAQQRLVALRIELELAEAVVVCDPQQGVRRLRELESQVDAAIDELRALARGVYPPELSARGLPDALRAVAARSALPVRVITHDVGRYPPEVESAVYFCISEALQNVLKHAGDVHRVDVVVDGATRELRFTVRDDGPGIAPATAKGCGLANMRDRMSAVGGRFGVSSAPHRGTVVRGHVPLAADDRIADAHVPSA